MPVAPRVSGNAERLAALAVGSSENTPAGDGLMVRVVDVIVPVHGAAGPTQRCVEGVRAAQQRMPFELSIIDDASRDDELSDYLHGVAGDERVTLIENPVREGFAAAVNRGFSLHTDRDAVVLHSDAVVANDWLDRLHYHAHHGPRIGVVAPFSNCGGVFNYPRLHAKNALPSSEDLIELDSHFARANPAQSMILPFVCGPCLYFRR